MALEQRARVAEQLKDLFVSHWCPGCGTDSARRRDAPVRTECVVYNPDPAGKLAPLVIRLFHMTSASAEVVCRDPGFSP